MTNGRVKGVIIAAGKGTRLLPLTEKVPKVMLEVGGKPIIGHIMNLMKSAGITDIIITTCHLSQTIQDYFSDGKDFGVSLLYTKEKELVGNAGGIKTLGDFIAETFVVIYGDNIADVDLAEMIRFHKKKGASATMGVYHEKEKPETKGIVEADGNGRIVSFTEKPKNPKSDLANAAIYILEPSVFGYIPEGFSDFGKDVFPSMLAAGEPMYVFEVKSLIDIGTFETLEKARKLFGHASR